MITYREFAINLARQAGAIITANFTLGMKKEWKSDNTPLTVTDVTINQLVIEAVQKNFPGHSVLAEEGSAMIAGSEYVWVCDPIDGTIPFSHGIPTCVFSLALVEHGVPILGVVYDPFMDRLYSAEKDHGAFLNDQKLAVSTTTTFRNTVIGIAYWNTAQFFSYPALHNFLLKEEVKIINLMSITYMAALVASGELVATVFQGEKPHDTAAIKVIVEEAGGSVTDVYGAQQRYDQDIKGHVASNRLLHPQLIKLIAASEMVSPQ